MNIFKRIFGPRIKISAPAPTSETQAAAVPKDAGNYSPDQPIQSKSQDRFNRWPFSERIASTIAGRQDPSSIVIGIYGAWGDGKSSVLAMMEEALAEHDDIVRVRFNPWYFKSEEQVLRSFFSALAKAIDRSLPTKAEKIGEALEKYGSLLSLTALIPGGPDAGSAAQGVGRVFASASEIDGLRDRIEGFLKESKKRVVVLIDDIDRLDRREIQTIFKLVKLSANFQHTAYVLAFDDKMVAEALGEAYANGGAAAGRGFLEKIVQVPLHLPVADALELRRMTFEGVDACLVTSGIELSEEQVQHFSRYFVDGIEPRLVTPRQAKLYTNTLMFALPLMKGEVNPVDQMLIEGIRVFYPDLYAMIRDNPEVFASGGYAVDSREFQEQAAALVAGALTGVASATAKRVRERLVNKLFPRLDGSMYGGDWDKSWENEQRVCSNDYFDRYFRYGVNPADVSDVALSSFLEKIPTADSSEVDQLFAQFNRGDRLGRLVAKLRASDKPLDPAVAVRLANLFARHAANLPRERQMFFNDWSLAQAGILLSELLRQLPEGKEREDAARAVFGQVTSLPFAFECVRWFRTSRGASAVRRSGGGT
jgi:predicted KAP-like P-loop ATPase